MRINHNIAALNTYRQLGAANSMQMKSMEKLSSGLRINRAGDDAAGLAISEKMRGQIRGLDQAASNAQDGISLIQTAEGALNETHAILQRMRELATQAANDTNTETDRGEIQKEINQLTSEINRIGNTTEFNTQKLLNGTKVGDGSTIPASSATVTGTVDLSGGLPDLSSLTLSIAVDGGSTVDVTLTSIDDSSSLDDLINAINGTTGLDNVASKSEDGKYLVLKSGTTGSTSSIRVSGTAATVLGLSTEEVTGEDESTSESGALTLQIGANQNQTMIIEIGDMRASALGISGTASGNATGVKDDIVGASFASTEATDELTDKSVESGTEYALDVTDSTKASAAISVIDQAIEKVSGERSKLGAYQNRLEHTINNLGTSSENLTAAESRIRDVDYALAA